MLTLNVVSGHFDRLEKNLNLRHFIDNDHNEYRGCKIYWNGDVRTSDYLFVLDFLSEDLKYQVDPKKVIFLTAEVFYPKGYYNPQTEFLKQFSKLYSCHDMFDVPNVEYSLPFLTWMIDAGYHQEMYRPDVPFHSIADSEPKKDKSISIICSSKADNEHHLLRYRFSQKLKEHFKDKIDFFGTGFHSVKYKREAIDRYKYHIVLENFVYPNMITEKLYDSYLGLAYPIYCGAPNVSDYFDREAYTAINTSDLKGSIQKIEQVLAEDFYEQKIPRLKKAKSQCLNEYNCIKRIADIALQNHEHDPDDQKQNLTIRKYNHQRSLKQMLRGNIAKKIIKRLNRL